MILNIYILNTLFRQVLGGKSIKIYYIVYFKFIQFYIYNEPILSKTVGLDTTGGLKITGEGFNKLSKRGVELLCFIK